MCAKQWNGLKSIAMTCTKNGKELISEHLEMMSNIWFYIPMAICQDDSTKKIVFDLKLYVKNTYKISLRECQYNM